MKIIFDVLEIISLIGGMLGWIFYFRQRAAFFRLLQAHSDFCREVDNFLDWKRKIDFLLNLCFWVVSGIAFWALMKLRKLQK